MIGFFRKLRRDEAGATIIEFAVVAPVLFLVLFGGMELAHVAYVKTALRNALQEASRASGLEDGSKNAATIDKAVEDSIKRVAPSADVKITRTSYQDFSDVKTPEDFNDSNANGVYDSNECFTDINGNKKWDPDRGKQSSQGGADDAVLYEVEVTYEKIFPLWALVGSDEKITKLNAETTLRNQPYGTQVPNEGVNICP